MTKEEFQKRKRSDVLNFFKREGADIAYTINDIAKEFRLGRRGLWDKLDILVAKGLLKVYRGNGNNENVYFLPENEEELNG